MQVYHNSQFQINVNYNVAKLKQMAAIVKGILGDESAKEQQDAEFEMLRLSKPSVWNIYIGGNMELQMENGFETFLFSVQEYTKEDLEKITVYRFYCLLEHIKNKNNPNG